MALSNGVAHASRLSCGRAPVSCRTEGNGSEIVTQPKRNGGPRTPLDYAFPPPPSAASGEADLASTPASRELDPTESDTEGPYYRPLTPERTNLREPDTVGQPLSISGRVLRPDGAPIPGAILDFWCCDGRGVYDNEGYRLCGHQFADDAGAYRVELVKPADYIGDPLGQPRGWSQQVVPVTPRIRRSRSRCRLDHGR
jgi:hypothetical protein